MDPILSPVEHAAEITEKNGSSGSTSEEFTSSLSVGNLPRYEDVEKADVEVPKVMKQAVDTVS